MNQKLRKPPWLKVRLAQGEGYERLKDIIESGGLHTVCSEALCPNKGTCWQHGRATIMILGDTCTRACRFCNVSTSRPESCDTDEPRRVAEAVREMGLTDVVITSVTRDDLPDGGATIWAETIERIHSAVPGILVEVLVPDFKGVLEDQEKVFKAKPEVFGHNLETVPSMYAEVRPQADYKRSLDVLKRAHDRRFITKTGVMLGLGEDYDEVLAVMEDARRAGCDIFYLGQYLQPSRDHYAVQRYVEPDEFERYREDGLEIGFSVVVSSPLVRSSFHTDEQAKFVMERLVRQERER